MLVPNQHKTALSTIMAGRVSYVYAYFSTSTLRPDFNSTVQRLSRIVICLSRSFTSTSSNVVRLEVCGIELILSVILFFNISFHAFANFLERFNCVERQKLLA